MLTRPSTRRGWRRPAVGLPVAGLLGVAACHAQAPDASNATAVASRTFSIVPSLSATQIFTTNGRLASENPQSELITQLSPGLHVSSTAGRIQGQLDYALNGNFYSKESGQNNLQNTLDATVKAEAVENRAFLDARANIGRQSISALGTQSPDPSLRASNQSQVSTYSLSPYLRGNLTSVADYEARLNYQSLHSSSFDAGNSKTTGGSLSLGSSHSSSARLGWRFDLSREDIDYEQSRATESERAVATLKFAVLPDLMGSARGGREASNIVTVDKEYTNTWGLGLDWHPSERTHVSLDGDRRYFGNSHSASIEYRTPRTVWRYVDTQNVTTAAGTATGSTQTAYGLLFATLASIEPDPTKRAQLVNATLASSGINGGTLVNGGFLTSAVSLQRRQEFSLAWTAIRTTVLMNVYQTQTSRLDTASTGTDDLSNGGAIRQRGWGTVVSHRLTPDASLVASFMSLKSSAPKIAAASDERSLTLTWSSRLSRHVDLSLSGRRVLFGSTSSPYSESALIAALDLVF